MKSFPANASRKASPFLILLLIGVCAAVLVHFVWIDGSPGPPRGGVVSAATPVPGDAGEGDPLDGDPLDGPLRTGNRNSGDLAEIEIVRSGRPASAPESQPAYDADPQTVWSVSGDAGATWVWFDFGEERPLREVRWLARGAGTIDVALSSDRNEWQDVGSRAVRPGWQAIELRQDARYVRLTLTADDDGDLPALAEVAAYGPGDGADAALKQRARNDERGRQRGNRDRDERNRTRDRGESRREVIRDRGTEGTESVEGASVEPGETRCRGKRAKCEAREGRVAIEEDCQRDGTCVIDIQADGGTAICDASGSDESAAGRGEGRRGGDGGRCEAVANGGTVTIGDINP